MKLYKKNMVENAYKCNNMKHNKFIAVYIE